MREKGFGLEQNPGSKEKKLESGAQPVVQQGSVPDISAHRVLVANRGEIAMRIMRGMQEAWRWLYSHLHAGR